MGNQLSTRKVLLGMSGGTDSSAAVILLQKAGYEVTGITFRFFESKGDDTYLKDAAATAQKLGVKHVVYDARELFDHHVIRYFVAAYLSGITPVPCIVCNNSLKWPLMQKIADEMGIYYLSTGHYAKIAQWEGKCYIHPGEDRDKEQSFFLWGLAEKLLQRIIFPLGEYQKTDMRQLLDENGLPCPAHKKDSMGVCFCPSGYQVLLRERCDPSQFSRGHIITSEGKIVGKHEGFPFYTVGQRRGLGLNPKSPLFVKEIIPDQNRIVVAPWGELYKQKMSLKEVNIIDETDFAPDKVILCRIRYRLQETRCRVQLLPDGKAEVFFAEPVNSVALGQAAAFYSQGRVIGGGIIEGSE